MPPNFNRSLKVLIRNISSTGYAKYVRFTRTLASLLSLRLTEPTLPTSPAPSRRASASNSRWSRRIRLLEGATVK
jgi:hypothetical protein